MPEQPQHNRHARLLPMLFLGAITICAIAEVVKATSLPQDLHSIQEQLIASKQMKNLKYDAPFTMTEDSIDESDNGTSHKGDKIGMTEFMGRPDIPQAMPGGLMDRTGPPLPARLPRFPEGPAPQFAPRSACLEDINRQMAVYGYTKSKLQLSETQKNGWKALEDALDAAMPKLRALCETLPNDVVGPPTIVERYEFFEKHLATRLDVVRALRMPIQQLLGQLNPDQRALLDGPPPFPPF